MGEVGAERAEGRRSEEGEGAGRSLRRKDREEKKNISAPSDALEKHKLQGLFVLRGLSSGVKSGRCFISGGQEKEAYRGGRNQGLPKQQEEEERVELTPKEPQTATADFEFTLMLLLRPPRMAA